MGERERGMTCDNGLQQELNWRWLRPCGHVACALTIQLQKRSVRPILSNFAATLRVQSN